MMGSLISRFRKKPTTEEQLKKIEDGLKKIDDYKRSTERKHKELIANIIIYSTALYILTCVVVFVWYLPESWIIRLGLLVPLVLVPVIIYFMKRLISKYFDSRMVKANEEYSDLQRKKKDIIDSVMETETFNKAKEILSKYAPEKLDKKEQHLSPRLQVAAATDLRKRNLVQVVKPEVKSLVQTQPGPVTSGAVIPRRDHSSVSPVRHGTAPKQRLPQPVFPKERGLTDKLVEFMIGDGPGYRYALICNHCRGHNGMALKEEFPYLAFNCCYCYQYNPARSKRPVPPKLPDIKDFPDLSASSTPTITASAVGQPETSKSQITIREETAKEKGIVADGNEKEVKQDEVPEAAGSDVKVNEDPMTKEMIAEKLSAFIDEVNEEKSDDEFQNLGFSESDLEFLRKVNHLKPAGQTLQEERESSDKET